jgi:ABC-type branched-subunit amino acid transport system substrate-binding protein
MLAFALVVGACGDDDAGTTTTAAPATTEAPTTTTEAPTTTTEAPVTTEPAPEIVLGPGVTLEPCPGSTNPENGCIYLGVISDFTGPFAGFGVPLTWGKEDFWGRINAEGGLNGFDIAITPENTVDAGYVAEQHVAGYQRIRENVAALAESLGTLQTLAAIPFMEEDQMVSPVSAWYSGFSFDSFDKGLILEAGTNYCMEAMNGFDFVMQARSTMEEGMPFTYGIIAFPGDYGGDYAAGVKIAAQAYNLGDPVVDHVQLPLSVGGTLEEAIGKLVAAKPDVIFVVTGPNELGQLMGGTFQAGHQTAMYVGVGPSFHPALLGAEALVPLLQAAFFHTAPTAGYTADTPGHAAMRAAFEANRAGATPDLGYVAGWTMSYNMKAVLEQAIANGDLSRAGILAAVQQVTVDYEGMLPPKTFAGDPNDTVERGAVIHRVDPTAPDGLMIVAPFFVGPTAGDYDFTAPCLVLGG